MGFKADLVTALRSGEYKQTTGSLRERDVQDKWCYCVEGVAADVAIKGGYVEGFQWVDTVLVHPDGNTFAKHWAPTAVDKLLSPPLDSPVVPLRRSLLGLNDDCGYTLEQLADVVEEHFEDA